MAEKKTFRSAFNGFNREDVVQYIEYMNAKHQAEVNQHLSETEFLRKQLAQARQAHAQNSESSDQLAQMQKRCAQLEAQLETALAEKEAAQQMAQKAEAERDEAKAVPQNPENGEELAQAQDRCTQMEAQLQAALAEKEAALEALREVEAERDEAQARQTTNQCRIEQELEAYRRAERMEREARERSQKVYHQVNGVLADATVKVDDAASQIGTLTDQVMSQLKALQGAVSGSKQALQDAVETMYALRPTEE